MPEPLPTVYRTIPPLTHIFSGAAGEAPLLGVRKHVEEILAIEFVAGLNHDEFLVQTSDLTR